MPQSRKTVFFILFFLSGFSGLIYESIWSHYLKLFLGHAAYAQTLVLAIFMGGMALGSLASGLLSQRFRGLLIGYAAVEAIIGILAIVFHPIFINVTEYTFSSLISGLGDAPTTVVAIKWGIASLLIFPQSVLLGMTFPLMVGGILRQFPDKPGYTLSMLYFTNSFGAVFGVLASSFILIGRFGLPGTMLTAGLLNIALALTVWMLARSYHNPQPDIPHNSLLPSSNHQESISPRVLLLIALLTGMSSFMYEMGWIRMLVLVLGGSTHSFELMLASFILGLALGGWWIRNRIDKMPDARAFLGYVQIAMALAAVLSMWLYHYSFDMMSYVLDTLQRKDSTYPAFLFLSGLISIMIMLPATFFAGMTLPLITRLIIKTRKQESGIGYVYSANTLGAIAGIFLSVHIIMPALGLKNLIGSGAAIDLVLGLYLLGFTPSKFPDTSRLRKTAISLTVAVFALSFFVAEFNVGRMSSGVFRSGKITQVGDVIYHEDGKTSTVTVFESSLSSARFLSNNGKPDASLTMDPEKPRTGDEDTQILLSAIPLFHKPDASTAAIIGMGSGMSTHTMLGSPEIELVDTIEMEAKILEASRLFLPLVDRAYNDPRSKLHVEDAKTFFSTHSKQYDIIVSEPPNPWVSGVSTLFSQEFYQRIKRHISPDGLFVQWIQLYEIDLKLVATIFNALGSEFEDYVVYRGGSGNVVIVASTTGEVPKPHGEAFKFPGLQPLLARARIESFQDFELNRIGPKKLLAPLFSKMTNSVNSDYFPILDNGAPRARYAGVHATELTALINSSIPVLQFLDQRKTHASDEYAKNDQIRGPEEKTQLLQLRDEIIGTNEFYSEADLSSVNTSNTAVMTQHSMSNCSAGSALVAEKYLVELGYRVVSLLTQEEQKPLWDYLAETQCVTGPHRNEVVANWHTVFSATSQRDYARMSAASTALLETNQYANDKQKLSYLISIGLLGDTMQGDQQAVESRWQKWSEGLTGDKLFLPVLLLLSNVNVHAAL